jgi:hypothetical protein
MKEAKKIEKRIERQLGMKMAAKNSCLREKHRNESAAAVTSANQCRENGGSGENGGVNIENKAKTDQPGVAISNEMAKSAATSLVEASAKRS